MKKYRAKELIALPAGSVVGLGPRQAADRAPRIETLGDGRYRLREPLQFKKGEVFGIEGEAPKPLLDQVEALAAPDQPGAPGAEEEQATAGGGKKKTRGLFAK